MHKKGGSWSFVTSWAKQKKTCNIVVHNDKCLIITLICPIYKIDIKIETRMLIAKSDMIVTKGGGIGQMSHNYN